MKQRENTKKKCWTPPKKKKKNHTRKKSNTLKTEVKTARIREIRENMDTDFLSYYFLDITLPRAVTLEEKTTSGGGTQSSNTRRASGHAKGGKN